MAEPGSLSKLTALECGTIQPQGRFLYGSNYTFLVEVSWQGASTKAVYKPSRGEQPLWDFPSGTLANREVAAFLVSRALGLDFVPPTVLRQDGPAGAGSLQLFIPYHDDQHYFTMTADEKEELRPVALFDALVNNADRKGGHILRGLDGRLWLIDHGLCFHQEDKLRTVVWDFAGQPIDPGLLAPVESLCTQAAEGPLRNELADQLAPSEIEAMIDRGQRLVGESTFPLPGERRPYPWPLV
jgi:uncharacterized repeat protein (TIGR03843 family)